MGNKYFDKFITSDKLGSKVGFGVHNRRVFVFNKVIVVIDKIKIIRK